MSAKPNNVHSAFEWKRSHSITSLNLNLEEYIHKATGALHYHFCSDTIENVFLVAFRTVPTDSTGVAHILEHTALCGSKNYPVRDPFFMMIRRSLNTFMNAFTSSDWTAYPFASQNKKDFNNLLQVYLDAVFFSNLNELDFRQEGHRLEFEKSGDPNSDLTYKGVVFNEMKGAMGQPVSLLWQTLTKYLFPSNTYHYNSGGDPADIPNLTYEQLVNFYKTHYHPSNAVFMTFGDIPVIEHHESMEKLALLHFKPLDNIIYVEKEKRYLAPIAIEEYYALDEEEAGDKTHIVMGWLLDESTDLENQIKTHLLSGVLLDNSASPLRHALETSNLGSSPSPLCGIEDSNREMTFMCGIEGSTPDNAKPLEHLVLKVLNEVAKNGIPIEQVEAVLHQIELDQREVGGGHYPYGLQLILDCLSSAIHRGDPLTALDIDPILDKLRNDVKDPNYIKNLVQTMLLDNHHRVRLTLIPDAQLNARQATAEREILEKIKHELSDTQKQAIIKQSHLLAQRQASKDDVEILPKVTIKDIPKSMHIATGIVTTSGSSRATYFETATNGLIYQQLVVDLPHLENHLLDVLPQFTACITELGCGKKDYLQMQAWQSSVTGGIGAFTTLRSKIDNIQDFTSHLFISSKALRRNQKPLIELTYETLRSVRFDEFKRIREIISQQRAQREQGVMGNGHGLAMTAASAGMCPTAALKHKLSGLEGIRAVKELDDKLNDTKAIELLAENFQDMHSRLLTSPIQFVAIAEAQYCTPFITDITQQWSNVSYNNNSQFKSFSMEHASKTVNQCWITSTPVNFCAKAYRAVPMNHEDAPALSVLAGFLRNGYLHRTIREQGGAYGGGASFVTDTATFRFYSYRDPRLGATLSDFDKSIDWLLTDKHHKRQIEEAILGVISSIDKPSSPAGEAKDAFINQLYNRTPELRQNYRAKILAVTIDDLKRVGEKYLQADLANTAIITNASSKIFATDNGMEIIQL